MQRQAKEEEAKNSSFSYLSRREYDYMFGEYVAKSFSKDVAALKKDQPLSSLADASTVNDFLAEVSGLVGEEQDPPRLRTVGEVHEWGWRAVQALEARLSAPTAESVQAQLMAVAAQCFKTMPPNIDDHVLIEDFGTEDEVDEFLHQMSFVYADRLEDEDAERIKTWADLKAWAMPAAQNDVQEKREEVNRWKEHRQAFVGGYWEKKISGFQKLIMRLVYVFGLVLFFLGMVLTTAGPQLAQGERLGWLLKDINTAETGQFLAGFGMFVAVQFYWAIGGYFEAVEKRRSALLKLGYRNLFWLFCAVMAVVNLITGYIGLLATHGYSDVIKWLSK